MSRLLLVLAVAAQLADLATYGPAWEINQVVLHVGGAAPLLKLAEIVLVVSASILVAEVRGPRLAAAILVLATAAGTFGAWSNVISAPRPAALIPAGLLGVAEPDPLRPAASSRASWSGRLSPSTGTQPAPAGTRATAIPSPGHILRGRASWVDASLGDRYLAARMPKGTGLRICGPGGCVVRIVNDYGPSRRLHPHRIVDLSRADFANVCGDPVTLGTCRVGVEVLGRIAPPATDAAP